MFEFEFRHKKNIEFGDVLKRKGTNELSEVLGSYIEENREYLIFYGFSVPRRYLKNFFESSTTDIHVYN